MASLTIPFGPATLDLVGIRAGDRNAMNLNITNSGIALNLTGYTVTAQARRAATDESPAITATVTVLNAATGSVEVRWPGSAVTALLDGAGEWKGVWDLQLKPTGSDPTTLVAGKFIAKMDVTRP